MRGVWRIQKFLQERRVRAPAPPSRPPSLEDSVRTVGEYAGPRLARFQNAPYLAGRCNVCGRSTVFFCPNTQLYRESLVCAECGTTSRYRSIARGILRAVGELAGIQADCVAALEKNALARPLAFYDTQVPFHAETCSYPLPEMLLRCHGVAVQTSVFRPREPWGRELGPNQTNQTLEKLTFPDASFDVVITSDVMEHVRLDEPAHREIRRVLKPGGVYLFTVPHFRHQRETLKRVTIVDPADPSRDEYPMEKEYHGDGNSEEGRALSYRVYGTELDERLATLGFRMDYTREDRPELGIMSTELFYCRLTG